MKGLALAFTIVPVPGTKPTAPYSICQSVAPPVVHESVTEVVVEVVKANADGSGHNGVSWTSTSSIDISTVLLKPGKRVALNRRTMVSEYALKSTICFTHGSVVAVCC